MLRFVAVPVIHILHVVPVINFTNRNVSPSPAERQEVYEALITTCSVFIFDVYLIPRVQPIDEAVRGLQLYLVGNACVNLDSFCFMLLP
jgi:hypothetical protein